MGPRRRGAAIILAACAAACSLTTDLTGFVTVEGSGDAAVPPAEGGAEGGTLSPTDAYGAAVAQDRPVAWFRFEESAGQPAVDSAGGAPGIYSTNGITFGVPGASGRALRLDGAAGRVRLGHRCAFATNEPFSIELWLRAEVADTSVRRLLGQSRPDSAETARNYQLYYTQDYVQFWRRGSTTSTYVSWSSAPPISAWVHVVVTYTASATKLYVNADVVGTATADSGPRPDPADSELVIGDDAPDFFYKTQGDLDEIALYATALPAGRVRAHYEAATRP